MKRTAAIGFVIFALLPIFNSPQLWAFPSQVEVSPHAAKSKNAFTVIVSRENFISLSWQQSGGFAGLTTSLKVEGQVLSYSSGRLSVGNTAAPSMPVTKGVSNHQLDSLIAKLNQTRIPALVGNYRQPNLADGFNEVLILTISDKNDQDQLFTIQNYGDRAPKGYFEFMSFFRSLAGKKFPDSPFAPAASPGTKKTKP